MNLDLGTIVVIIVFGIFYIRLMILRNNKQKESRRTPSRASKKEKNKTPQKSGDFYNPRFQVTSWWLVAAAVILMLVGVALNNAAIFSGMIPAIYIPYWWIPTAIGGFLFNFCIK
jgi:hypothetical protein